MNHRQQVLLLSLVLLVGCRGDQPVKSVPLEPDDTNSSSLAAADSMVDALKLTKVSLPQDGDPASEGWQTEATAAQAMDRLKHLGEALFSGAALSEFGTNTFRSDRLIPPTSQLETKLQDRVITVKRWTQQPSEAKSQSLDDTMAQLSGFLAGLDHPQFKFKLFKIETGETPSHVRTIQYAHFSGTSDHLARELNATWEIEWMVTASELQIDSVSLTSYEQVESRIKTQFTDVTHSALGHNKSYSTAIVPSIPHWRKHLEYSLGVYNFGHHGLSVGDANGDGLEDLYVCQTGGLPNHLFLQNQDGTFRDSSRESNVDFLDSTRSALFLDLDNDDDQDLVLALNSGLLFLENIGAANFSLRARIPSVRQAFSLAGADYDQDGLLDIFICVYYGDGDDVSELPLPVPYFNASNGGQNHLIRNAGNWRFDNVTESVGLDDDNQRFSFAATWEDYDLDGDLDLLVVNDFGPNHLFQNNKGHFRNVAAEVGLVDGAFGMSSSFGDYDRDGFQDLYVGNMFSAAGNRVTFQPQFKPTNDAATRGRFQHLARGNSLFRNLGSGQFQDVSVEQGITMGRWSWSSLFADINSDGWEDIVVTNGFVTGESKDDL